MEELWFAALAAHHIADDLLLPASTPVPLHAPGDAATRDSQMVLAAELALCMGSHAMLKPIIALALAVRAAAVTKTPDTARHSTCARFTNLELPAAWPA